MAEGTDTQVPSFVEDLAKIILAEGMKKHVTQATELCDALSSVRKIAVIVPDCGYDPDLAAEAHQAAVVLTEIIIDLMVSSARKDAQAGMREAINFIETAVVAKTKLRKAFDDEVAEIAKIKNQKVRSGETQ